MDIVKNRILVEIDANQYLDFGKHKDLIAFVTDSECFITPQDKNFGLEPSFSELIVIVEKEWLFDIMRKEGILLPLKYLQETYTSDNSYNWYKQAIKERKVVTVSFN